MPLKDDLLTKGYLPENLPPPFHTRSLGSALALLNDWHTGQTRAAPYNASKRGMTRRVFSFVHPSAAHDLAKFIADRENELTTFFGRSSFSLSRPRHTPDGDRAVEIDSHSDLESARLARLSHYRFIARTDVSRFYHSIYTHSVPWALHGKAVAKADRSANSANVYANRLDLILRNGQDGQTVGIPVGPDASRYVAEMVGTAIDQEFVNRGGNLRCDLIRHVDDIWIGANTHADAEEALWRYREAIRSFELDINESKTEIFSENFRFSDAWPNEIAEKFEFANNSIERRVAERLRAAFEHAFLVTTHNRDDGVLKYTLRYLDRLNLASSHWSVVEPFLKRAAVHYGHTIDYVSRLIVWRHLRYGDLSIPTWGPLLVSILDRHGRLGNDAEVVWSLYAVIRLRVVVPDETARVIVQNCGPLSLIAVLKLVEENLVTAEVFRYASDVISTENAAGPHWPLILEWKTERWAGHEQLVIDNDLMGNLIGSGVTIFEAGRLPTVFQDVEEDDFSGVDHAIEERSSQYNEAEINETAADEIDEDEPF